MLASEAWRNLVGAPTRTVLIMSLVAVLTGTITWVELTATSSLIDFQRSYDLRGGYLTLAYSQGRIDAARCERLTRNTAIEAAGGFRSAGTITPSPLPASLYSLTEITPGLIAVDVPESVVPTFPTGGYLVGGSGAKSLGLSNQSYISFAQLPPGPVAVVDLTNRAEEREGSFMSLIAPQGMVDGCMVELTRSAYPAGLDLLSATFADAGPDASINVYRRPDEFTFDPVAALADRPQARAWIAMAGLLALINWLILWFRRSDLALYTTLGSSRTDLAFMMAAETILTAPLAWIVGALWSTAIFQASHPEPLIGDQLAIAARNTGSGLLLTLALIPIGTLLYRRTDLATQLKDR